MTSHEHHGISTHRQLDIFVQWLVQVDFPKINGPIIQKTFPCNCNVMSLMHFVRCHFRYSTHWSWVTPICVCKLTIIGSDNGLSPGRCQAIIWTSAGILLIGPSGTNFSEISIVIQTLSFRKMHLKMSSAKWRPFHLNVINAVSSVLDFPNDNTVLLWLIEQQTESHINLTLSISS